MYLREGFSDLSQIGSLMRGELLYKSNKLVGPYLRRCVQGEAVFILEARRTLSDPQQKKLLI